jgi:hypothetical protein
MNYSDKLREISKKVQTESKEYSRIVKEIRELSVKKMIPTGDLMQVQRGQYKKFQQALSEYSNLLDRMTANNISHKTFYTEPN